MELSGSWQSSVFGMVASLGEAGHRAAIEWRRLRPQPTEMMPYSAASSTGLCRVSARLRRRLVLYLFLSYDYPNNPSLDIPLIATKEEGGIRPIAELRPRHLIHSITTTWPSQVLALLSTSPSDHGYETGCNRSPIGTAMLPVTDSWVSGTSISSTQITSALNCAPMAGDDLATVD